MKKKFTYIIFLIVSMSVWSAGSKDSDNIQFAVVIPGVTAGNPLYEQLVEGIQKAVDENPNVEVKVIELGFNQSQWTDGLKAVVATGTYDIVFTSNPSMPNIGEEISREFPDQKFVFLDGFIDGHPNMTSYLYNQREQSYMLGHMAGLLTTSSMEGANSDLKIGLIVGQSYPVLDNIIKPAFMEGARAVNADIELDLRILGNWYDATKAAELTKIMIDDGVDVIGVIVGAAASGVFKESRKRNTYAVFWDSNAYSSATGIIAGCVALNQRKLAYEVAQKAIDGRLDMGKGHILSVKDGYVEFITDDPAYIQLVPKELRARQQAMIDSIKSGALKLDSPQL